MADTPPSRHLEWEGCLNARDLGGLPTLDGGETRWRSVIRADYPGTLTPAGLEAMLDYGVRTLIDIRSPQEAAAECYNWAEASSCRRLHLPIEKYYPHVGVLIRQATSLVETYCIMVDAYPDCVAAILAAIAEAPPGGVLVHCWSGKDRTGTIVALLLTIAGVPVDAIAADYAISQERLWPEYEQRLRQGPPDKPETLWTKPLAEPAAIYTFLEHMVTHYGGVQAYLAQAGLSADQILQLRRRLVPEE
jgi:protein-tyrosine phosphatase